MIKKAKAAARGETHTVLSRAQLKPIVSFMETTEHVQIMRQLKDIEGSIEYNKEQAENYAGYVTDYEEQAKVIQDQLDKMEKPPEITPEAAGKVISSLLALPWVQEVLLDEPNQGWIRVLTRENSLFTTLIERRVVFKKEKIEVNEILPKPVKLALPRLSIAVNIGSLKSDLLLGTKMCKNNNLLVVSSAVRGSKEDFSKLLVTTSYAPSPFFASNGTTGYGWLCLGQYVQDVGNAFLKQGIVAGFESLAEYIQSCGSSQAYMRKIDWICRIGNPVYNEFIREAKEGEDPKVIDAQYREAVRANVGDIARFI